MQLKTAVGTQVSRVALFWLAFVLTRPFGATLGDVLTKGHEHGGLDLGTIGASAVLFVILAGLLFREHRAQAGTGPSYLPAVGAEG